MPLKPRLRAAALALVLAGAPLLALAAPASPAAAAAVPVTVTTLHFKVSVGPAATARTCDIVGDLYVPAGVTAAAPAPAILTTNGFGGSKDDQDHIGRLFGQQGYVTLSYSGLGFGRSGCQITDDDPDYDGVAARQLVSFLGGAPGIAFSAFDRVRGWTGPVDPLQVVRRDATDHAGVTRADDPRVGMIGGSYGGQIQFAAASVDPRIDTLIPLITWNELVYSLTPGNGGVDDTTLQPGLPGVSKREWSNFFFAFGQAFVGEQLLGSQDAPAAADATCLGFRKPTCDAFAQAGRDGYAGEGAYDFFHHSSVAAFMDKIKIPVLLGQGQADTLFNLQEATATYSALKARGVPVKMMWQSWGHSRLGAAPGEYASDDTLLDTYQGQVFLGWFDFYLKDKGPSPNLDFEWFRPWAYTTGGRAQAEAAYGRAPSYPVGTTRTYNTSGTNALVPAGAPVASGSASLVAPVNPAAASYSETSVVGVFTSYGQPDLQPPPSDAPGTAATWTTTPFATDTDVVGIPSVDLRLDAPLVAAQQSANPSTHLVLFAKLYDVSPGGAVELPERLVSPVRVADVGKPLHIALPGIVHRFAAGHSLRLVVAGSDAAYSGNLLPFQVAFPTSSAAPGVLSLPVVEPAKATTQTSQTSQTTPPAGTAPAAAPASSKPPSTGTASNHRGPAVAADRRGRATSPGRTTAVQPQRTLAFTGLSTLLPLGAAALLVASLVLRRRILRRHP